MRLIKRLLRRLLIFGLIFCVWLIVFVVFETADRRLPWILAVGITYGIAAYRVQSRRPSGRWSQHPFSKALSEDLAPAQDGIATKAAGDHQKLYDPPRERQIGHVSPISAMDTPGNGSA
jgi:hypothetical protein